MLCVITNYIYVEVYFKKDVLSFIILNVDTEKLNKIVYKLFRCLYMCVNEILLLTLKDAVCF
jgi:hypothetical protein